MLLSKYIDYLCYKDKIYFKFGIWKFFRCVINVFLKRNYDNVLSGYIILGYVLEFYIWFFLLNYLIIWYLDI